MRILDAIAEDGRCRSALTRWPGSQHAPIEEARDYLCALPGVGRKTAACVLLFSFGRHDVPVDTHVFRVGTRLGLFRPGASLDEAHDEMLRLCPRGRRLRGSRAADPARQAYLRRACPALRRVPAEAHVPGGQAPAQSILRRSTTKMSVSLGPMGPEPCAP